MVEYIGIDIGGTNIRIGSIDENDNILFEYQEPTYSNVSVGEDLYNKIKLLIKKVPNYETAKAIGIGAPGSIDKKTNTIITSENLSILNNFPLTQRLTQDLKKKIYIENDARVANLAEALKGNGKDKEIVCYITISTGLGGGVVINKQIYSGSTNLGAYFSRMILNDGKTADSLISGTALIKETKQKINRDIENAKKVFELAQNNQIAKEIIDKFKQNLTVLFLNVSSIFNPDIIILGGGVLKSREFFLEDVKSSFRSKAHPLAINTIIDIAKFKEPGIIGAALFAKYNNQKNDR